VTHSSNVLTGKCLVATTPLFLKFWANLTPVPAKTPISIDIRSQRLSRNT